MKNFFTLALLACAISAEPLQDMKAKLEEIEFVKYMTKFGKEYLDIRVMKEHMEIWRENKHHVEKLNSNPESMAKFELNATSDMTQEELKNMRGVDQPSEQMNRRRLRAITETEGADIDFSRQLKAVKTGLKNNWTDGIPNYQVFDQGQCDSGYAFAANTVQELMQYQKSAYPGEEIQYFSVQQILDCSPFIGNSCQEGRVQDVWNYSYLYETHLEKDYGEYLGKVTKCRTKPDKKTASKVLETNHVLELPDDKISIVVKMSKILYDRGPLTVVIQSDSLLFQSYHNGIITAKGANYSPDEKVDYTKGNIHSMALIGQDYDDKLGIEYWILQNSYGAQWGEQGFIRIEKTEGPGIFGMNQHVYWTQVEDDYGYGYKSYQ